MSVSNLLVNNRLHITCGGINFKNNKSEQLGGIIYQQTGSVIVSTTATSVYTLVTSPGNSYNVNFIMSGICVSGSHINLAMNQNTQFLVQNVAGVVSSPDDYLLAYSFDAPMGPGSLGQTTTVSAPNVSFNIIADTTAGNTWDWSYTITVTIN